MKNFFYIQPLVGAVTFKVGIIVWCILVVKFLWSPSAVFFAAILNFPVFFLAFLGIGKLCWKIIDAFDQADEFAFQSVPMALYLLSWNCIINIILLMFPPEFSMPLKKSFTLLSLGLFLLCMIVMSIRCLWVYCRFLMIEKITHSLTKEKLKKITPYLSKDEVKELEAYLEAKELPKEVEERKICIEKELKELDEFRQYLILQKTQSVKPVITSW